MAYPPADPTDPTDPSPFPDTILHLWRQYPELHGRSRQRPSPDKLTFIRAVLHGTYTGDASSCSKSHVRARYRLAPGAGTDTLQYLPEDSRRPPRTVVDDDEAFDLIVEAHVRHGHAGREKVFHYLKERFYHVTREEVGWVLRQCLRCKVRCKGVEAQPPLDGEHGNVEDGVDERPSMAGVDADAAAAAEDGEEGYLPGAYTKKFNALRAESKLDESEWMTLCLSVARDVRGPAGLDVMLAAKEQAKAWDEHFGPLCDAYVDRHWGAKTQGRCWAGDSAGDRVRIKDFLRRLFMNFFQKERVHRARIARKAAKAPKPADANAPPSEPAAARSSRSGRTTTWMRSHPPIKIPPAPQPQDSGAQNSRKRLREMGRVPLDFTADGQPARKNPRLERVMVLLADAEKEREKGNEKEKEQARPPDTGTGAGTVVGVQTRARRRGAAAAAGQRGPSAPEPTPHAVFRLDPVGAVFPPVPPPGSAVTPTTTTTTTTTPATTAANTKTLAIPIGTPSPPPAKISPDLLFLTYVQRAQGRHEIRLVRGDALAPLPLKAVLEKLHRKHRLAPTQLITAVVLDFSGSRMCIDVDDEDAQSDWETWVRVEGPGARQVEVEVKITEVVV